LALAQRVARAAGSTRGRAVGALLVSDDGRLLAASAHRTVGRRADHAELLLAQRWWSVRRAAFPSGARVYVTREPCRMCAAALASLLAPHPVIAVVFGEAETGPSSRGSALAARQRACGGQ
jgi:tRNA(Arg) A34 adenosine deaminase TadA